MVNCRYVGRRVVIRLLKAMLRRRFGDEFANVLMTAALLSTSSTAAQVVDHYYLDPQNVAEISKFRSCAGHHYGYDDTFSGLGIHEVETDPTETNRSMKHYFSPLQSFRDNGSNNTLELHAPFDGTIYRVTAGGHDSGYENKQVWIQSDVSPDIFAIVFHVNLLDLFPDYWNDYPAEYWSHHGDDDTDFDRLTVSSGEVIGYADLRGTISDIAILRKVSSTEYHYLSYFDDAVMTEQVFALYQRYGLNSRGDVIVSRAVRNANPLPADCWGGRREGDWFRFTEADDIVAGESSDEVFRVSLEEPVDGQIHMGVGNLRGWAVSNEDIARIEILIDGIPRPDAPYGGNRTDVGNVFPDIAKSSQSGFSLAFNYSALSFGQHTITATAHTTDGKTLESSATFEVVRFDREFIPGYDAVDLTNSALTSTGNEITITDVVVDGVVHDLTLKWRPAEQGFEIIEIR